MRFGEALGGYLRINAGRVGRLVSEQVLGRGEVARLGDHVGREPGPEAVRREAGVPQARRDCQPPAGASRSLR